MDCIVVVGDARALGTDLGSSYPASVQFFSSLEVGASSRLDSENSVTSIMIGPFQYTTTGVDLLLSCCIEARAQLRVAVSKAGHRLDPAG